MAFYVNGTERPGGTEVFASSATDTAFCVYDRQFQGVGVIGNAGQHLYGSGRAVSGAVAASHAIGVDDTIFVDVDGVADLYGGFICRGDGAYSSSRTDVGTSGTFRTAVAPFVRHFGLHQPA